ncbi:hypothetical protein Lal_00038406 [Lupinus albus]|uniref:Putative transcription factor WRKY family n=1 Tax=Lupinus albus TaxID=3870 RepID=A0A6A4NZ35_LUPAL|nr:putative transcription factor WRKY family [Lupinus albus]KAF1883912.1 hypothetical protein Lal_00038406 [Lupinus albus]
MENIGSSRSCMKAIEELERGREFAKQLRDMIDRNGNDDDEVEKVVQKVLMSFTNSLFLFHNNKERRGSYSRRKNSETREHESETPIEDGHQWRKYGQKVILNAKYPRNYYRCSHKYDQNCEATKQVQRVKDNPPLHKTTYYGNHTCTNPADIILHDDSNSHSSLLLCFDNSLPTSLTKLVKKECKEDDITPSNDYILSPHLTFDNSSSSKIHSSDYMDEMSSLFCHSAELHQLPFTPFFNFHD